MERVNPELVVVRSVTFQFLMNTNIIIDTDYSKCKHLIQKFNKIMEIQ